MKIYENHPAHPANLHISQYIQGPAVFHRFSLAFWLFDLFFVTSEEISIFRLSQPTWLASLHAWGRSRARRPWCQELINHPELGHGPMEASWASWIKKGFYGSADAHISYREDSRAQEQKCRHHS